MDERIGAALGGVSRVGERVGNELWAARVSRRAGMFAGPPRETLATLRDLRRWGQLGGLSATGARRHGARAAIVDELGTLSFAELDEQVSRLANAWRARGLRAGDGVAVLCRNHRWLIVASCAAFKAGARLVLLNSDFAGPQIREVGSREGTRLLVHDDEWAEAVREFDAPLGRVRAWTEDPGDIAEDTLAGQIAGGDPAPPPRPESEAKLVILTSGTTGTPKGAPRSSPKSLVPVGGVLDKIPFRSDETTVIAIPMFHALGFVHGLLALGLGSTMILRRRFDPVAVVDAVSEHRATAVILVPTMLRRILDLGEEELGRRDLRSLRIVFLAGSQLGGELARRGLAAFGPTLYNLYGSTEVSAATIATPDELQAAPDCVGTPPRGTVVRLFDDADRPVTEPHVTARIFAGTGSEFEGYTGGGTKTMLDGMMATGDVGHFDEAGRLFIDGRDDDMIISGGENLFPGEIEELLNGHPEIVEAAVIGVPDDEFGARLRAYVVRRDGAALDEDAVRAHVRESLARFKVPRDVVFLAELPRNPTGKVLKRRLAESERSFLRESA
jgi:fatty-acyl-CoA synthase